MRDNLVDLEYLDRSHKNIDTYGEYHIGLERGWNTARVNTEYHTKFVHVVVE